MVARGVSLLLLSNIALARSAAEPEAWYQPLLSGGFLLVLAVGMIALGYGLGKGGRPAFWFAGLALLAASAAWALTRPVDLPGGLGLLADAALLVFFLLARKSFF